MFLIHVLVYAGVYCIILLCLLSWIIVTEPTAPSPTTDEFEAPEHTDLGKNNPCKNKFSLKKQRVSYAGCTEKQKH